MPTNNIAVAFPLEILGGAYKTYATTDLTSVVEQNIKMVLLTNPGERIFDASFGVGLRRYLFLTQQQIENGIPGSDGIAPLRNAIISQINNYIPYITVRNLELSYDQHVLSVKFEYFLNNSPIAAVFDLTISEVNI